MTLLIEIHEPFSLDTINHSLAGLYHTSLGLTCPLGSSQKTIKGRSNSI